MKKAIVSALLVLCSMAVFVSADTHVGDEVHIYNRLECPGVVIDDNITDGHATYIYLDYFLEDPDGIVRYESDLIQWENNLANMVCSHEADKPGVWTCTGNMMYQTLDWDGTDWVVSGDVCNTSSSQLEVFEAPICGNGVQEVDEECDDGNTENNDLCSSTCEMEICGDNIVQVWEECDGSNDCEADCTLTPAPDGFSFTLHEDVPSERFILADAYVRRGTSRNRPYF